MKLQRMKDLREDQDLSQEAIAQILNINQRTYSGYETGIRNIPLPLLSLLADYYHTSLDYLTGRTDEKKPYPPAKKM